MKILTCKIKGCGRKEKAAFYCFTHYKRYLSRTDLHAPIFIGGHRKKAEGTCHCGEMLFSKGMCRKHYAANYKLRKMNGHFVRKRS